MQNQGGPVECAAPTETTRYCKAARAEPREREGYSPQEVPETLVPELGEGTDSAELG